MGISRNPPLPSCRSYLIPVAYDLDRAKQTLTRESLRDRVPTLWRYAEVLPVEHPDDRVTLVEA
jgi:threonine synthase